MVKIDRRKSPQQEFFDAVYKISIGLKYPTFDYLPQNSTVLPFVFIGEQFDQDKYTKTNVYGTIQQTINIYGGLKQRRLVTEMAHNLNRQIRSLKHTDSFYIKVNSLTGQTFFDNSEATTFSRHILEVSITFH